MRRRYGRFTGVLRRADGTTKKVSGYNSVTTGGLSFLVDRLITTVVDVASEAKFGLIDASGYTALAVADTMTSHAGWSEFTGYTGNRRSCVGSATVGPTQAISATAIQMSGSGSIKGAFIALEASTTKGNTSGTLWCTAVFDTAIDVVLNDELDLTYTMTEGTT